MIGIKRHDPYPKKKRKTLSLALKRSVLMAYDGGMKAVEIAHTYDLRQSTVSTILKQRSRIIEAVENEQPLNTNIIRKRHGLIADMETLLRGWCRDHPEISMTDQRPICEKAREIFDKLKQDAGEEGKNVTFIASVGWFCRFKKRYEMHSASRNKNYVEIINNSMKFNEELKALTEQDEFTPQTIFNVKDVSLFWKKLPKKNLSENNDNFKGFREEDDWFTIMLGSNASGDCKLKPLLVYHSENPKAIKNKSKAGLPVIWKSNPKGTVSASMFEDWFGHHFIPEVERYCDSQNIPFKVMLILDDSPRHPPATLIDFDSRVKVIMLPEDSNTRQPMDQGVLKTFKACYIHKSLEMLRDSMFQNDELQLEDYWSAMNILDAIRIIGHIWTDIPTSLLRNAWRNISPYFTYDNSDGGIDYFEETTKEIISLSRQLNLEMSLADITNFLESQDDPWAEEFLDINHEIEDDDEIETDPGKLMTVEKLTEGVELIENGVRLLEDIDSNVERVMGVRQGIHQAIACYIDILREKSRSVNSSKSLNFVQPSTSTEN